MLSSFSVVPSSGLVWRGGGEGVGLRRFGGYTEGFVVEVRRTGESETVTGALNILLETITMDGIIMRKGGKGVERHVGSILRSIQ
mmetsp:Transcript_2393/g.4141  ORF Transcript_2393/g.4141 Transcript_2393/m.4141 type:complete len:85 (-) Transcript_2393:737-991(-)